MAKQTININGSASQMVDNINSNFNELYQGAGGGSSSGLKTKHVKVYDVMGRGYRGGGAGTVYIPCDIIAGRKYIIEQSATGSIWSKLKVTTTDANKQTIQTMMNVDTSVGEFGEEIAATSDAAYFGIFSYSGGYVDIYHYEDIPVIGSTRWLGKRWLVIGASMSTEHQDYADVGYPELVATALGMFKENHSISGQTVDGFYNRIDSYGNDFDLISVLLGTNDHGYSCPVGSINDSVYQSGTPGQSYIARLQLLYEKLRLKFPKSVIVFITPIKRYDVTNDRYMTNALGLTTEPYAEAMRTVCKYYSIPCIDIFNAIDPATAAARENFFVSASDGTHPNDIGQALFIAPIVEAKLREIAPFYFNDFEND